ncbi:MAG: DUF4367 domain-containing protein [Clostridia bacterium]|nr:DUF4367 domain-containing protein [Clostridia bacterium]
MIYSSDRSELKWKLLIDGFSDNDVVMFNNLDTSNVIFNDEYYKKRDRIVKKETRKPKIRLLKRVSTRIAVAILVLLSVAFMTLMSISAVRNAIWNVVIEWYDEYIDIKHNDGTDDNNSKLDKIEFINKPTVLPDGVEEEVIIENNTRAMYDYYVGDEYICSFTQGIKDEDRKLQIDSEKTIFYTIDIDDKHIFVFDEADGSFKMYWTDQYYDYLLYGFDTDVMLKLIDGIK